jgi:HK97 family phage prohead protease
MSNKIERRTINGAAELRADDSQGDEMALVGYACIFGNLSKDLGGFRETIAPGAFTRTLKEGADVKALVNHDPNQVLGRLKNGTLKLEQDARGLKFRVQLNPDSQAHRDLYASIKRGDLDECSYAFMVNAPDGDTWDEAVDENGKRFQRRTLRDLNLIDISAVCYPAGNETSVAARSTDAAWVAEKKQWLANVLADAERKSKAHDILMSIMKDS